MVTKKAIDTGKINKDRSINMTPPITKPQGVTDTDMVALKIGNKLWKSASPYILEYKVIGMRNYADGKQYELECQTCAHGQKCRILVGGNRRLVFIDVLNDEEDTHHYWHSDATRFWPTRRQAQLERLHVHIRDGEKAVEEAEKTLTGRKNHLNKLLDSKELVKKEIAELEAIMAKETA